VGIPYSESFSSKEVLSSSNNDHHFRFHVWRKTAPIKHTELWPP
jgi:hypothetical protein